MMAGRTIADRDGTAVLAQGLLAQRLGHGVGVGPAQRRGAGPAGVDQLGLHPVGPVLFGLGGQQGGAGAAQLLAGLVHEPGELVGLATGGLGVGPQAAGAVDLSLPVDVGDPERAVIHLDLGGGAAAVAGDVAGGHGHQVGGDVQVGQGAGDAGGAHEVDLDGEVERRVEAHRGRRVDDDVAAGEQLPALGA
jgi:hypothetical protein